MNIKTIIEKLNLKILSGEQYLNRQVTNGYCCDLLSWVMAHGSKDGIWITVQTHINIVAVAALVELSCIIIPEDIEVEQAVLEKAEEKQIVILSSNLTGYQLSGMLYEMGIGTI